MFAQAMSRTNPVTPSRRFSGAVAPSRKLLWPRFPSSTTMVLARNRFIVASLMPFWSGASTSLTMAW